MNHLEEAMGEFICKQTERYLWIRKNPLKFVEDNMHYDSNGELHYIFMTPEHCDDYVDDQLNRAEIDE